MLNWLLVSEPKLLEVILTFADDLYNSTDNFKANTKMSIERSKVRLKMNLSD